MEDQDSRDGIQRRTYLATAGVLATLGIAGCSGDGSTSGNGGDGNTSGNGGGGGGGDQASAEALEVLHGWTDGDGKAAIEAVIQGFKENNANVKSNFKAIGGGGNINLNSLINQRLSNNDPPSSWQSWPGARLRPFAEGGILGDIEEEVWSHNNMMEGYTEEMKQYSQVGGTYVCVPISTARKNNLFYNVSVVEEAGVDPTSLTSIDGFLDALAAVEEQTDAVGLVTSLTEYVPIMRIFEATMQGVEGHQAYMDLVNGNGDVQSVANALSRVKELTEYFNEAAATEDNPTANQKIVNGEAAFLNQGSWVAGTFKANDLTYGEDWDVVEWPGTKGMYGLHSDGFTFANNSPAPKANYKWLRWVGSKEAQVSFNNLFGMVPPRSDISTEEFGPFVTDMIKKYNSAKQRPPTLEGLAATPSMLSELGTVFSNNFMGPYKVDPTAQGIVDAMSGN